MCRVDLVIDLPEEDEVTKVFCYPQPGDSLVVLLCRGNGSGPMLQLDGIRRPAEASSEVLFKAEYIIGSPEKKYALLASVPEYGLETRCSVRQGKALVEIRAEGWDPETRAAYSIQVKFHSNFGKLERFLEHWGGLFGVQMC
jgi:hypothetical protein